MKNTKKRKKQAAITRQKIYVMNFDKHEEKLPTEKKEHLHQSTLQGITTKILPANQIREEMQCMQHLRR